MSTHHAARRKTVSMMNGKGAASGLIFVQGGSQLTQYDSDTEIVFRQDSWFNYLFGVKEAGFFGAIDLATAKSTLFMPRLPEVYKMWMGSIHPPEHFKELYDVDEVLYTESLGDFLRANSSQESRIHVLHGTNSDSGKTIHPPQFDGHEAFTAELDTSLLYHTLATARVTKSAEELEAMRYASFVASNAHVQVMRLARPGMMEYELEARFRHDIYAQGGCRLAAYTSICACGPNAAVLHYGHAGAPNDRQLLVSDWALLDMGADYHGYVSDITCTFPLSGTFTDDQRAIYNGVLNAQRAVLAMMAPGVSWLACHQAAEREILKALVAVGCLVGDVEEMMSDAVGGVFFPHGLGHLIGCDTHDVGGYLHDTPTREARVGWKNLRTARLLEPNMVLTNEPGCYFIDFLIDKALATPEQARHINAEVLARFRGTGGVRLEDVVVVTEAGVSNLTLCPRTPEEVEAVRAGGPWPPQHDAAPELRRAWARLEEGGRSMVQYVL